MERQHPLYDLIEYNFRSYNKKVSTMQKSINVLGIDTEADKDGRCFMIATSLGDVFKMSDFPGCMFSREYRGKIFVAYNLKYDEGAFLQFLPRKNLAKLREKGKTIFGDYKIAIIPRKYLRITKGKNSITIYDLYNFYNMSLNAASKKYLNDEKLDIATKSFSKSYIEDNWNMIAKYCVKDAVLVEKLGNKIIKQFETWGVYPRALYSTAYVTYQYFRRHTNYVDVSMFWEKYPTLLWYAYNSYNGGKFEVTRKGLDYYYEYDIVSAYPYEIANLIDLRHADVIHSKRFVKEATYGFLWCNITIEKPLYSPVVMKQGMVNTYPIGNFIRCITLNEYIYLCSLGCKLEILDAVWMVMRKIEYPYREEIYKLMKFKNEYKMSGDKLNYHIIKIFLNSLYGKFCQLIKGGEKLKASSCWNPVFASIITANTRIRISEMQNKYPCVVAVHTDSVISTKPLDFPKKGKLGDFVFETEGEGVVLGSGIYQIGNTTKLRGFYSKHSLVDLIETSVKNIWIEAIRPFTWREVLHRNLDLEEINRFQTYWKKISVAFDRKRIWLNDYKYFSEVKSRKVYSIPYVIDIPRP